MLLDISDKTLRHKVLIIVFLFFTFLNIISQEVKIVPLKIGKKTENVFASDFFDDKIYFCSDRKIKSKVKTQNENNTNFFSIYSIGYDYKNGKLMDEMMLDSSVNSVLNEGPISFNDSSKIGCFSSNIPNENIEELILGLYQTKYNENGTFQERSRIFEDIEGFNLAHPTISSDGKVLVFSSDLKGKGIQTNLYWSFFQDGKWTEPQILEGINTDSTETLPHFHYNTLYFASNRAGGLGGLDIYKSKFSSNSFSEPQLLPAPINSEFDDFLFIPISSTQGIFSSNRMNYSDGIYGYQYELPEPTEFINAEVYFCYELEDEVYLDTNRYEYHWEMGDGSSYKTPKVNHCYADTGVYNVSCNIFTRRDSDIDTNAMEYTIEIKMDTPFIDFNEEKGHYFINSKYSKFNFDNFYWIVNGSISFEPTIKSIEIKELKLVVWSEKSSKNVLGIQKNVTLD